jgi:hypothetical protein
LTALSPPFSPYFSLSLLSRSIFYPFKGGRSEKRLEVRGIKLGKGGRGRAGEREESRLARSWGT